MHASVAEPLVVCLDEPEFEHEPCCEWVLGKSVKPCSRPAAWACRCLCKCGDMSLACSPCVEGMTAFNLDLECEDCGMHRPFKEFYQCTRL